MRLLCAHHIDFDPRSKLDKKKYIITLEKGKQKTLNRIERDVGDCDGEHDYADWPQMVSDERKAKIISMFRE